MEKLDWRDYGAIPDGVFDCTAAINNSFSDAIANGLESHGPAGRYKITGPLLWNSRIPRISGMGASTVIEPDDNHYTFLTIGTGGQEAIIGPAGWVRDLRFQCQNVDPQPTRTTAGVLLDSARFVEMRNVWVAFAPIGFDLINNCFGTSFYNCRTFSGECGIGLLLRGSGPEGQEIGAGNDISFYNCWFHGREAGVWLEGNQGLYHFHGGQLAGGFDAATSDDRGACLTSGKSFTTGLPMGTCGASFVGVTFERAVHGWNIRHFGAGTHPSGLSLYCAMCSFFGGQNANLEALGVLKLTGGYNDIIKFDCCSVNGFYTNAVPISIAQAGGASRPYFGEFGARGVPIFDAASPTPVAMDMNDRPMMSRSSIPRAFTQSAIVELHNGIMLNPDSVTGDIFVSTDYGVSFTKKLSIVPV